MGIKNTTLGACLLLACSALAQNHNTYKVHKGDSLASISKHFSVSKEKLIAVNHLSGGKKIKPGSVLKIPTTAQSGSVAAIKAGQHDNDHTIAKRFNITPHQLRAMNMGVNWNRIHPGQTIRVPGSKSQAKIVAVAHRSPSKGVDMGGYAPYTIRKNDSDWTVAHMFGMTPKAVKKLNPHLDWENLRPGSKIRIPFHYAYVYKLGKIPVIRSRYAVVTKDQSVIRRAPGANAGKVTTVDSGTHVMVLARDAHWYKLRFPHGTEGWVRGDLLKPYKPEFVAKRDTPRYHEGQRVAIRDSRGHRKVVAVHQSRGSRTGYFATLPDTANDLMAYAQTYMGTPYGYGHASRSSTDCSGFTTQVFRKEGVKLPRTAAEQSRKGVAVGKGGLKAGDLVFFHTSRGSRVSHVGIYMGSGKFIHASSGGGHVQVSSLNEGYYKRRFATARRVAKVKQSHQESEAAKVAKAQNEDAKAMKAAEKNISKGVDAVGN